MDMIDSCPELNHSKPQNAEGLATGLTFCSFFCTSTEIIVVSVSGLKDFGAFERVCAFFMFCVLRFQSAPDQR